MKSYWIDSVPEKKQYKKLTKDIETDICIIGGGLTGLSVAYYLNEHKIRNIILEKDEICHQTSGLSTAKVTSQHGLFYQYLMGSKGKEVAKKYYQANEEAIHKIEGIIQKEKIDCNFEKQSSYVFTQNIQEQQNIKAEVEAVKEIGGIANYIESKDILLNKIGQRAGETKQDEIEESMQHILPIKALCAIEFPNQAQFNPYKYAMGLAQKVTEGHTQIFEDSKVVEIQATEQDENMGEITLEELIKRMKNKIEAVKNNHTKVEYQVKLENGCTVRAKYVVIATKYPILNFPGYYFLKMYQSTSNVIVVETKETPIEGMYINAEAPTISIRSIKYEGKNMVLIAGFDHKTGANIDLKNGYQYLEKVAQSLYPNCKVRYRWNTQDCISLDKIPYIGPFSTLLPHIYVATGYNKWGVTTSNIAARMIVDAIMERQNPYTEVFNSTRMEPVKNRKEVGSMLKQTVQSLVLEKLEIPKETLNQVQKGEGNIIEIGGKKVGIYKNELEEIFLIKPVCQHLGCELTWNNLDKTWDCPCHGSRYDYKGNLLYGPSVKNLEKL